jgi:murein L,D-transpeptidase YafK
MTSGWIRASALALPAFVVLAAGLARAADPHPERQLLSAIEDLHQGRVNEAWTALDQLVKRQPNFRLAQLFYKEVQAARNGTPSRDLLASNDPDMRGLAEEARLRLEGHETPPPDAAPDMILQLSRSHKHAVVVDLTRARLYLLENKDGQPSVIRNFYAASGKGGWGKRSAGDNRTPVGVYRVAGFISDQSLPELYGAGAFPLDYPNLWDRRLRLTGSGIWLHGVPRETYARVPRSSEGCVTLANADLLELKPFVLGGDTPVVFADAVTWKPRAEVQQRRGDFLEQVEAWRARWSAKDTEGYLAFYADDFESDGMQLPAFKAHKRRVNAAKKRIDVQLQNVDLYHYPGDDGLMLAHFTQKYSSDNYQTSSDKQQYWRRQPDGSWKIVKEANR